MTITEHELLGATILCPHCTQPLKVVRIVGAIADYHNPTDRRAGGSEERRSEPSTGWLVQLEDGQLARFWATGPRSR
jgi:hypothetical protein